MTIITLPAPPSANRLWRSTCRRVYRAQGYVKWLREAGWTLRAQHPGRIPGDYAMRLLACPKDKRKRDLDNLLKATSDLLVAAGVVDEDSRCRVIEAAWVDETECPKGSIRVAIEPHVEPRTIGTWMQIGAEVRR